MTKFNNAWWQDIEFNNRSVKKLYTKPHHPVIQNPPHHIEDNLTKAS